MRVLLLGATGNLGIRLIPSLLSHSHTVIANVRNPSKLSSLLAPSLLSAITVTKGDATSTSSIHRALIDHNCDALICTAGFVVMNPWGEATLPKISEAAADAAILAAKDRGGKALRCWFLAGLSLLDLPGSTYFLGDYIPVGREHIQTLKMLQTKPVDLIDWSILCPSGMNPAIPTADIKRLDKPRTRHFAARADIPPLWQNRWFGHLPLVGGYLGSISTMANHVTTLEENADFLAEDLGNGNKKWSFRRMAVKDVGSG